MGQWTQLIQQPLYQAAAVILAGLLLLVWLWRRRPAKPAPKTAPERPEGLWRIVSAYQESHPSFFFILDSFQANHTIDQLCKNRDVMDAFQRLDRLRGASTPPASSNKRTSSLHLLPPSSNDSRAPQAAMATILRGIYSDINYSRDLPITAHEELDRFLDSLTL